MPNAKFSTSNDRHNKLELSRKIKKLVKVHILNFGVL